MSEQFPLPDKTVIFTFHGGPFDGDVLRSDDYDEHDDITQAHGWWSFTEGGQLHKTIELEIPLTVEMISDGTSKQRRSNVYYIKTREETKAEVIMSCHFAGSIPPPRQ